MAESQTISISEPAPITQPKPETPEKKEAVIKTETDIPPPIIENEVKNVKVEDGDPSVVVNETNVKDVGASNDASSAKQVQEEKVTEKSETMPGGGTTEKVVVKTEEIKVKEEKVEEVEVALRVSTAHPVCEDEVMKDETSSKKKKKKKDKKSKKEKKKEKKARKEAKRKRKRELEQLDSEKKQKKDKVESEPDVQAANIEEPPMLQPVPAEEDLLYQSNTIRYDCPPNRDFTDFENVEPTYILEDSNVDEMSPWKTRRCVGPILDFVKEQKAKGLDLDVPYEGQEVIKAPDPPKKPAPEFRVRAGGGRNRYKGKGKSSAGPQERATNDDEYASLLSDFVQKQTEIDYF